MCHKIVYKIFVKYVKQKQEKKHQKTIIHPKLIQSSVAKGGWVFLKSLFYVLHLTITVEYKMIGANLIICGRFEFCQN